MKLVWSVLAFLMLSAGPAGASADHSDLKELLPRLEGVVADIDRYLLKVVEVRSGPVIGAHLIEVIYTYPFVDLRWLENRLRRLNTSVYLVGQPKALLPAGVCAQALWPFLPGPEFTLWVGINGRDEMLAQLKAFGIESEEQNRENLMRTGIMIASPEAVPPTH